MAAAAHLPRDLDAGDLGHLDVEEHEIRRARLERLERRGAILDGGDDLQIRPELAQLRLELLAQDRLILGDDGGRHAAF